MKRDFATARVGTQHAESIIGGRSFCGVCGWIDDADPTAPSTRLWHGDSFAEVIMKDSSFLFELRIPLDNSICSIKTWEGERSLGNPYHMRIDVEVRHKGKVVFPKGATYCGLPRMHSWSRTGNHAKELVMSLVAMKPGDTDPDYFNEYTEEQLAWVKAYGEYLSMEREARYCDENGNVRRD